MGKKVVEVQEKAYLGRPSNNVSMGLVGLPNVGKSTLFNALSKLNVAAENFAFCTIDPTDAKVPVPDERFEHLCSVFTPKSVVPAVLTITDIAGIVKGAHEGKGLGNEFLANIQAVDGIYQVTRAFKDKDIEHYEGDVNPVRDMEIVANELVMKDLARCEKKYEELEKVVRRGIDKTKKKDLEAITKALELLKAGKDVRSGDWAGNEITVINSMNFLTAKPIVYLINIREKEYRNRKNKWLKKCHEWIQANNPASPMIPFCAKWEYALNDMTEEERKAEFEEHKVDTAFGKIVKSGYEALHLHNFFTVGKDEVRAWTIRQGTLAPQAAGTIHGDFCKHFISADQYNYEDFVANNSDEGAVIKAGKKRERGKLYLVEDGDILNIKHNAGGAGKKKK